MSSTLSLPSGDVTLLFSDLQGSTVLVQSLGEDWAAVLDRSRELCRAAWSAHGGHEMGTEGDSFFVVFAEVDEAVAAAVDAQRAMAEEVWARDAVVQARMGMHTGSPTRHGDGYIGLDVHLAARVAGAAHGGQVLLSSGTVTAIGCLPPNVGVVDLGEHRLKDIADRVGLHQLVVEGLRSEFPPLATKSGGGNLPQTRQDLVGRAGELAEVGRAVADGARLMTLTGPGGSGKTRLALAVGASVAHRFPDGVYFVPLATVTEAPLVWAAVAQALELPGEAEVPLTFHQHVRPRKLLLVLDNLEQLPGADAVVAELLRECPEVQVLATSRRRLHLSEEVEHVVPPLELPPANASYDEAAEVGAVRLFVLRARRVRRTFVLTPDNVGDVVAVCRAVDGLPLAVEIAAARVKLLSPAALVKRLDRVLDVSSADGDRPDRQRSLRATIAWSHQLLTGPEQLVFAHLGVFAGGADLPALEAVVPDQVLAGLDLLDVLGELVDSSFVTVSEDTRGEPRFALLETLRAFASDELGSDVRGTDAHEAYGLYFRKLMGDLRESYHEDPGLFAAAIDADFANITELVRMTIAAPTRQPERGWTTMAQAVRCAQWTHRYTVAERWVREAEARLPLPLSEDGRSARIMLASRLAFILLVLKRREDCLQEATRGITLARAAITDGVTGHAEPFHDDPVVAFAVGLGARALMCLEVGDLVRAAHDADELFDLVPQLEPRARSSALSWIVDVRFAARDWRGARAVLEAIRSVNLESGDGAFDRAWLAYQSAELDLHTGDPGAAGRRIAPVLEEILGFGDLWLTDGVAEVLMVVAGHVDPLLAARVEGALGAFRGGIDEASESGSTAQLIRGHLAAIKESATPEAWEAAAAAGAHEALAAVLLDVAGSLADSEVGADGDLVLPAE